MWRLVSLIAFALVAIFGLTFTLNAPKEEPKFCEIIFPSAVYYEMESVENIRSASGLLFRANLVNPKINKSSVLSRNFPGSETYDLDGNPVETNMHFTTIGCNCFKEFLHESQDLSTLKQYFAEKGECTNEECFKNVSDERKDKLFALFQRDSCGFCNDDATQDLCICKMKKDGKNEYVPPEPDMLTTTCVIAFNDLFNDISFENEEDE